MNSGPSPHRGQRNRRARPHRVPKVRSVMDVAFVGRRKNEYFGEPSGICLRTVSDEAQVLTPLGSPFCDWFAQDVSD